MGRENKTQEVRWLKQYYTLDEYTDVYELVNRLPREILPMVENALNEWEWPNELGEAPTGWENMTPDEKFSNSKFRALCDTLGIIIPTKVSLRYHHTNNLGRSEEEFEDWWQSEIYDALKLLGEKQNQQLCSNRAYSGKGSSEKSHSKVMFALSVFLGTFIGNLLVYGIRFLLQFL
jgi:hypothetical protein